MPSRRDLGREIQRRETTCPAEAQGTSFWGTTFSFAQPQVQQFQDVAGRLQKAYAGEKAETIQNKEQEVSAAWQALLEACAGRRTQLVDTADKFRFFSMARDLLSWMESVIRQIETQEKPR